MDLGKHGEETVPHPRLILPCSALFRLNRIFSPFSPENHDSFQLPSSPSRYGLHRAAVEAMCRSSRGFISSHVVMSSLPVMCVTVCAVIGCHWHESVCRVTPASLFSLLCVCPQSSQPKRTRRGRVCSDCCTTVLPLPLRASTIAVYWHFDTLLMSESEERAKRDNDARK